MRAVCGDFFGATKPHRPDERCPAVDCICGLWAWSDEDRAVEKFDELLEIYANTWPLASQVITVAVGAVSMWGRVIEHEEGWRSELAYPYEIRIPSLKTALYNPDRVRSGLRDCYAVEVDFR